MLCILRVNATTLTRRDITVRVRFYIDRCICFHLFQLLKAASPLMMSLTLGGATMQYLSIIVTVLRPPTDDVMCRVIEWLQLIGFTVLYGSLALKLWRFVKAICTATSIHKLPRYLLICRCFRPLNNGGMSRRGIVASTSKNFCLKFILTHLLVHLE